MKGNKAEVCNLKGGTCESRSIVMLVSHVEGWGGPEGGTEQQRADESRHGKLNRRNPTRTEKSTGQSAWRWRREAVPLPCP